MRRPLVLALAILVAACTTAGPSQPAATAQSTQAAAASLAATVPPTASATHKPVCPNHDGGAANVCLGPIEAGTYTTQVFQPPLTYTVGAGWGNFEDEPGNFLLIPPGSTLVGVNPGTSDYLGVYASVGANAHCSGLPDEMVQPGFDAYIAWLKAKPSLKITHEQDATVGGLSGVRMDIVGKAGGDKCPDGSEYADVYAGLSPSELVHGVGPNYPLRVWFLHQASRVLAIEVADAPDGGSSYDDWFTTATDVVNQMVFTKP